MATVAWVPSRRRGPASTLTGLQRLPVAVLLIFHLCYGPAAFGLILCAPLRCFGWHNLPLSYIGHLLSWLVAASFSRSAMARQVSLPQVGSLYDAWMELSDSILDFDKDGAVDDTASAGDNFHLVCECATTGKEWFPVIEETSRARLGRGDLTPATIHHVFSAGSFNTLWTNWVDREFRDDAGFKNLLIQARVFDAICLARKGRFFADSEAMGFLLRRWNKSTHTFIAAFGEITITLEDVAAAILLPILGDLDPRLVQLDADEQAIESSLLTVHHTIAAGKKFNAVKTAKLFDWL
ncbi:hypothetical protein COLO4_24693 [Corchorus olitorius]|uniref:Aminotransferase-like plant mobile domain-containing protein n=1 Tax=Corchorus olitorius TaxID=93759 RepID=A0A1R3I7W0_9ROSI|nr:hypothetical protein COLO4_24693 [Corchorus olitorius]